MSCAIPDLSHKALCAMETVNCELKRWGGTVIFRVRKDENIERDKYRSVKRHSANSETGAPPDVTLKAWPITFNPTSRELQKAGLKEKASALVCTSSKAWLDLNYTFDTINAEHTTVIIRGREYEITEKTEDSPFMDAVLYYNFGITKK